MARADACYQVWREPANAVAWAPCDGDDVGAGIHQTATDGCDRAGQRAQESRAIGDIISSPVDRDARNSSAGFAPLTHRAPDFTQTLLAVPPQTTGVLSHHKWENSNEATRIAGPGARCLRCARASSKSEAGGIQRHGLRPAAGSRLLGASLRSIASDAQINRAHARQEASPGSFCVAVERVPPRELAGRDRVSSAQRRSRRHARTRSPRMTLSSGAVLHRPRISLRSSTPNLSAHQAAVRAAQPGPVDRWRGRG
jgi:hypothetical protein